MRQLQQRLLHGLKSTLISYMSTISNLWDGLFLQNKRTVLNTICDFVVKNLRSSRFHSLFIGSGTCTIKVSVKEFCKCFLWTSKGKHANKAPSNDCLLTLDATHANNLTLLAKCSFHYSLYGSGNQVMKIKDISSLAADDDQWFVVHVNCYCFPLSFARFTVTSKAICLLSHC